MGGVGALQAVLATPEQHGCVMDAMPLSLSQNATSFSRGVGEAGAGTRLCSRAVLCAQRTCLLWFCENDTRQ